MHMKKLKKFIKAALVAAFWLIIWELLSIAAGKEVLLPSPVTVARKLIELFCTSKFWKSCAMSLARITAGLFAGALLGTVFGAASVKFKTVDAIFSPVFSVIRATPVASFIILALVWIGRGNVPSFTSFLMVMPVVCSSVTTAVRGTDRQLLEMLHTLRVPRSKILTSLYIPTVLPSFAGGFRTSLGLAWKAGVAAEVLCTPSLSIGTSLYESKVYLETAELFAWTVTVVIMSMILEHLFDFFAKRIQNKYALNGGDRANG